MSEIHMGALLERAVKKRGISITAFAIALDINRRTLYNWFKQKTIDEVTMRRISGIMLSDRSVIEIVPDSINPDNRDSDVNYWQDKYIVLLERYTQMLATHKEPKTRF